MSEETKFYHSCCGEPRPNGPARDSYCKKHLKEAVATDQKTKDESGFTDAEKEVIRGLAEKAVNIPNGVTQGKWTREMRVALVYSVLCGLFRKNRTLECDFCNGTGQYSTLDGRVLMGICPKCKGTGHEMA